MNVRMPRSSYEPHERGRQDRALFNPANDMDDGLSEEMVQAAVDRQLAQELEDNFG